MSHMPEERGGEFARSLYIDLLKRAVSNTIYEDPNVADWAPKVHEEKRRIEGLDWPAVAHTMVGLKRLENVQVCLEIVIREGIPGDFIETGVWRGGTCIFARGILKAHGVSDRTVWVADSFEGLPPPDPAAYPADRGDRHHEVDYLRVSLEDVQQNFRRYGLLDGQVRFLKGWFKDTLPAAPIDKLAVLRLDGDMYESTMDALTALYPKVVKGGFVIIDDYGAIPGCKAATDDFRAKNHLNEELTPIDWTGVFWRRPF